MNPARQADSKPRPQPTDSPEQAAVVNAANDDDVLVVAGAGSGKTYTMTRRIITLIGRGVPPEKILGLTFTRKAASELLSRVSTAVAERPGRAGANPFLKPEVSTYDAFFQSIVRQYGLLVGFDQNTQPLSQAGARQLAISVIDEHMDLLRGQGFGGFSTVVDQVLALSSAIGGSMMGEGCVSVAQGVERVRQWDQAFIDRVDAIIGDAAVPDDKPKVPTAKGMRRKKRETDEQYRDRMAEAKSAYRDLAIYHCAALRDVARQRDILLTLVDYYDQRKRELNMAEFNDFTVAAYALVTRFPSIGERFRRRYTHVLLDEYQDTSTTQAALLTALFHPGESGDGAANASVAAQPQGPRRSAVNAVGDPFQSIYAWRGASPGAFRMFERDFGMGETARPYALSVTRRNARVVLEAANDLTEPLRRREERASSSLMREVQVPPLETLPDAKDGTLGVLGLDTFGQEVDAVARFAKAAIARHTPKDPDVKDVRPHVAVLFRGKTRMNEYVEGLEKAGLSTLAVGYSALLERPEVRDVLALLHVAADHTDSNALMRLLATPRFALKSPDLNALARLVQRRNDDYRFRALAEAGVVPADAKPEDRAALVREHRDKVPNMVFLADLLCDEDLDGMLARPGVARGFTEPGLKAIRAAGAVLRQVGATMNRPLSEIVQTAVRALGLDVDTVVAQAMSGDGQPLSPSLARSPMDSLVDLCDTYIHEIAEGSAPTLRGFVSWVDSLDSIDDSGASVPNEPADVVLMTIHQAKGLEWDAVAIVDMQSGSFPSNQGEGLKVTADEDHIGGFANGSWHAPQYKETARTWLDDPSSVPVPVRADAAILPRFPHDAQVDGDPLNQFDAFDAFDTAESLVDEADGDIMRPFADAVAMAENGGEFGDEPDYLSQSEEYGRRLHADERRLAYVALTRAREDVLLTYCRNASVSRIPDPEAKGQKAPSNFWSEVCDALANHDDKVLAGAAGDAERAVDSNIDTANTQTDGDVDTDADLASEKPQSLDELEAPRPDGIFVGERAGEYKRMIVDEAWAEPVREQDEGEPMAWPASLSQDLGARLDWSAQQVRLASQSLKHGQGEVVGESPEGLPSRQSLAERTRMLLADEDLVPRNESGAIEWSAGELAGPGKSERNETKALDEQVRRRGRQVLQGRRQNVTSLQAGAGRMSERESQQYWRGLVRPIPHVASPAAQAGTRFHAWAERFVNAFDGDESQAGLGAGQQPDEVQSIQGDAADALAAGPQPETRVSLLADLVEREQHKAEVETAEDRKILVWQRRLADGRWAGRRPYSAEQQIVVSLPELDGGIVNGKLDAVFYGGLDESDASKRFTVVDWKTGRRPKKPDEIDQKLAQLDMYRLLLAKITGAPLESIDATLYYVSERDERDREIHARPKDEQSILSELRLGVPTCSDND
ncbi:UvrD-helicase domain-containing protein [Bifidobacterium sp. ESL0790]|uniref:ATP-dependent DNA helicase n=1 Tax=Bifidobacterium sp. ESL0790 TaxID=2983233 RepID=UPI0023F8CF9D|nr:UvrD-helicase domain-containing protein [Bifidobacterium sp. ESL0790]WEV73157.1 UvrD-helicase domain-containing protein [Bifidobacterium sp. ESL0790]